MDALNEILLKKKCKELQCVTLIDASCMPQLLFQVG